MDPMDNLCERLSALEHQTETLTNHTRTVEQRLRWQRGLACSLVVLAGLTWALPSGTAQEEASERGQKGLAHRVAALQKLLKHISRDGNEIIITGANLHIVNGLGQTGCPVDDEGNPLPGCPSGLGNLIVGYNEPRGSEPDIRTGSHNVVVGDQLNFSRFGGVVVVRFNTITGGFVSVSGGQGNTASGGSFNTASGLLAVVSGGTNRTAEGDFDWVAGSLFEDF